MSFKDLLQLSNYCNDWLITTVVITYRLVGWVCELMEVMDKIISYFLLILLSIIEIAQGWLVVLMAS